MGMAASQARLLTITARMHDVEYQAQSIQNAKIRLATQEDEVRKKYLEALDATTFTIKDMNGNKIAANFNTMCGLDAVGAQHNKRYVLRDSSMAIIVSDEIYNGYNEFMKIGGNAYSFALYMMEGCPANFDGSLYHDNEVDVLSEQNKSGNLGTMTSLRDQLSEKIYEITSIIGKYKGDVTGYQEGCTTEKEIKNKIRDDFANAYWSILQNKDILSDLDDKTKTDVQELVDDATVLYEQLEYLLYTQSGEEVYAIEGNHKDDFDDDDFWTYVNYFKQIEANGGRMRRISDYDGLEAGNAASNTDWLQSMVQSGQITIDESSLDKKGNISFKSTAVSSDSALEYTTTTTIDKTAYAKAEAEYEHRMKEIDSKDKKFDLDLSKLETERNALKTEYDSVKKVVQDNIERTFGIFS